MAHFAMENQKQQLTISNIVVDLGGKNTGILFTHGSSNLPPNAHSRKGMTLVFPEKGLNLSQKARLAKRHQRRGFKRRRLSKRLLQLILAHHHNGNKEQFNEEFQRLRTFLNRRGYTYLTLEEIEGITQEIQEFDFDTRLIIVEILGKDCGLNARMDFLSQLEKTDQQSLEFYRNLVKLCEKATTKENKEIEKDIKKKIRIIAEYAEKVMKSEEEGHKTRSEYLECIRHDLSGVQFTEITHHCNLTTEQLANLIGHIANLQLRVLRRYFNDVNMAEKDYWNEKRLEKIFVRHLRSWHIKKSSREFQNREQLLQSIKKIGLLKTFLEINPELSIPPFEDMNNRRPPTCRSLHIDETKLDKDYPGWREWIKNLVDKVKHTYELENAFFDPELLYIEDYYKKSQDAVAHKKSKGREAILLQRLFERSAAVDEYRFRAIVLVEELHAQGEVISEALRKAYETGKTALDQAVGAQNTPKVIALARRYFREIENAKRGLWLPEEIGNITFRCDRKPRQKKNLREELIGHILATDFHGTSKWSEWEKLYTEPKKINNRSSIAAICRNIEEARKGLGDEFHWYWNRIRSKYYKPNPDDKTEKEVLKHKENAEKVAKVIAELLAHDEKTSQKYANPYSLAQIYNIMDGDVSGFYSTCPACTHENFWRSSQAAAAVERDDGTVAARAVRLPADTMRPFDGFLARYLDRIGQKVALAKWRQLEQCDGKKLILVPILLEQNRFRFNSDMAEIKESARKKQAQEKMQRAEKRFEDKWERIRKAGKGICPYTGEPLGKGGEFDHILPRSYSKGSFGTVFNTEMNLIYASSTGNRKKGDLFYTLKDLHPNYLKKLYGTSDTAKIVEQIKKTLQKFDKVRSVYFHNLEENEQRDFRHALFERSLIKRVQDLLHTQYKMRVSGMQGYLARVIYEKILKLNESKNLPLSFKVFAYDAGEDTLAIRRENLAKHNAFYAKPKGSAQAPGSHVIDTTMVWAHALERGDIPGLPPGLILEGDALEELLPDELQIVSLAAREKYRRKRPHTMQIFKDTIYAERYLNLIVSKNKCGFGYDLKNMVEFEFEKLAFVFELLRPFAAFRGAAIAEPLEHYTAIIGPKKKFVYFNIVREKAAAFLQKNAYAAELSINETNQMALLTGLRYFTLKNNIFSALSDLQGKAKLFEEKDTNKFWTKINIKLEPSAGAKPLRIAGEVKLPQLGSWQAILSDKTIKELAKKSRKWTELAREESEELIARHFKKTIINPHKHHGVRKVYSLPLPDNPSGGFRIQRRRDTSRQFHVQGVEGAKFAGFAIKGGKVDFNSPVIMPLLMRENSLASTDGYVGKMPQDFVFMDEWREIPLKNFPEDWKSVKRFYLQPNSESRMRVRIELENSLLVENNSAWHLIAPLAISTAKVSEDKEIAKLQRNLGQLLNKWNLKPRDKVNLVAADRNSTTYEFVVQSTNSQMQEWYNLGKPCAI